jgi:hypothetical protein
MQLFWLTEQTLQASDSSPCDPVRQTQFNQQLSTSPVVRRADEKTLEIQIHTTESPETVLAQFVPSTERGQDAE